MMKLPPLTCPLPIYFPRLLTPRSSSFRPPTRISHLLLQRHVRCEGINLIRRREVTTIPFEVIMIVIRSR